MKIKIQMIFNPFFSIINWPWEITFVPMWIALCISLVGVLYTIIFAGFLLRMNEVNAEQRRSSTNSALGMPKSLESSVLIKSFQFSGYSFLVIPMLVFLVLITNKLDSNVNMYYFSACAPLFLTFFTLIMVSFGSRGGKSIKIFAKFLKIIYFFPGNQYWFGLRQPPCQFLFGICPCLQLFGNISYSLYNNRFAAAASSTSSTSTSSENSQDLSEITLVYISNDSSKKKAKKLDHVVVPALALEMPD